MALTWRKLTAGHYQTVTEDGCKYGVVNNRNGRWYLYQDGIEINAGRSKQVMIEAVEDREQKGVRQQKALQDEKKAASERDRIITLRNGLALEYEPEDFITHPTSIRMSGVTRARLDALAREYGTTRTQIIARLVALADLLLKHQEPPTRG